MVKSYPKLKVKLCPSIEGVKQEYTSQLRRESIPGRLCYHARVSSVVLPLSVLSCLSSLKNKSLQELAILAH
ncbi:hypothetical protein E2C01_076995 [Portunus trituberculatus]|uniref:Uncharacterized protein n=1 Tax=Portunus trituberculatus TaxID=210409 RepID=A0A5B7IKK1_PORTR|nr:hypothetical protein [Portunus trituberculatus]